MFNTLKITINAYWSTLCRHLPLKKESKSIEEIMNYLNYDENLSSSGQPEKDEFSLIRKAGYTTVISLVPEKFIEGAIKGEEAIVTKLGMKFINIPVNFFNPEAEDYDKFVDAMESATGEKVWVHCAVNARASAFIYKYRCLVLGVDKEAALWEMREIWEPFGPWRKFTFEENGPEAIEVKC